VTVRIRAHRLSGALRNKPPQGGDLLARGRIECFAATTVIHFCARPGNLGDEIRRDKGHNKAGNKEHSRHDRSHGLASFIVTHRPNRLPTRKSALIAGNIGNRRLTNPAIRIVRAV